MTLRISEIKRTTSILISYFFKNVIVPTLLTSTKLDKKTIKQHITRAREINQYLNYTTSTSF
jgi:preprotein translocase subunit SecG